MVDVLERLGVRVVSFDLGENEGISMLHLLLDLPRGVMVEMITRRLFAVPGVRSAAWPDE